MKAGVITLVWMRQKASSHVISHTHTRYQPYRYHVISHTSHHVISHTSHHVTSHTSHHVISHCMPSEETTHTSWQKERQQQHNTVSPINIFIVFAFNVSWSHVKCSNAEILQCLVLFRWHPYSNFLHALDSALPPPPPPFHQCWWSLPLFLL